MFLHSFILYLVYTNYNLIHYKINLKKINLFNTSIIGLLVIYHFSFVVDVVMVDLMDTGWLVDTDGNGH